MIPYGHPLGHRGFSHSLLFGLILAVVIALRVKPPVRRNRRSFGLLILFVFVLIAAHGIFDAMTDGGKGVGFFIPLDNSRYFLPVRPIPVSLIGIGNWFANRNVMAFLGELGLLWLPGAIPYIARYFERPYNAIAAAAMGATSAIVWAAYICR